MEKIRKYVERFFTKNPLNSNYDIAMGDVCNVMNEVLSTTDANGAFSVVSTLFKFGYAKGYRAAIAKMKKGGAA